ncbi:MAG: rhamnulose-1-phosphate aldolase [Bacteroidales bacterium]|nr:rhamnulose-1-phosphate aldolase [Bacteroidales bacterium]
MKSSILDGRSELAACISECAEVACYLWEKGWAERNGGNMTYNITSYVDAAMRSLPALEYKGAAAFPTGKVLPHLKGCWFYAKGTGRRMRDLARKPMENGCIIRITDDCAHYEMVADSPVMPTSELPSHLALQDYLIGSGSSYKATLHTHPIELVAMSHIRRFCSSEVLTNTLWSMIPETLAFAPLGIGFIPFANPGTVELADETLKLIGSYDVVLWEKHGTVAVGIDMMDAFDQTDVLNKAACIYKSACQMGNAPEGMSEKQMKGIQELFNLPKKRVK